MIVSMIALRKIFVVAAFLIVAEWHVDCRCATIRRFLFVPRALVANRDRASVGGGAAAIAFDVHLQDGGVMHEAVDGGEVMAWSRNTLPDSPKG